MRWTLIRICIAVAAVFMAYGQVDTGTITGTVRDSSGALVPNARLNVRSGGTGRAVETTTNAQGIYVTAPLRPGEYEIEVQASGFSTVAKRVQIDVSQRAAVDFTLEVGSAKVAVTVQDFAATLQTESPTLSNLRSETTIKDLPLNGRNFTQLILLAAGAVPAQSQQGGTPPLTMLRGVTGVAVNGGRLEDNNFLIDGISNSENHNGLGILMFPSVDAIQEFRVESSVADAQFGHAGGGTINISYKSGTTQFHGGAYEFLRNSSLDAKNFFDSPIKKIPPFKQNQFGAFLGGPVFPWKSEPKTFFFANFEGLRVRQAQTYTNTVPTTANQQGDFSAIPQRIYDPLTQVASGSSFARQLFAGNIIPASRIDSVGANILNLFPAPNLAGLSNNFLYNPVRNITGNRYDLKGDQIISNADTLFARYSHSGDDFVNPGPLPAPAAGNGGDITAQPANQILLSETHILSPTKINESRLAWTRLKINAVNLNFGKNIADQIGIPGSNEPGNIFSTGLPVMTIAGLPIVGDNGFRPALLISDNLQWNDNFTYIHGRHTFKFGGEIQRRRYNAFQSSNLRGTLTFDGSYTQNPAASAGTGSGAADVLLGRPISGGIQALSGTRGFRRTDVSGYAQDVFIISTRLTLTLALRYENFVGWPWTEVNNRMYQFVPSMNTVVRVGTGPVPWRSGIEPDNNNFGPRVGLAYRLASKTVFRAGYGLYYSPPQWDVTANLAANPPEFVVSAFTNNQFDFAGARPVSAGFDRPPQGTILGASIDTGDGNMRIPYTHQWNATIQQELPGSVSVTAAYVGTAGIKQQGVGNINQPVPGTTPIVQRRPFPLFNTIRTIQDRYNSSYNALQVTAERRFGRGFGFQVAYTYSHSIDDLTSLVGSPIDIRNIALERGNASTDLRQRLVASWTYELPFKTSGSLNHLIGGWQVNGILSLYDGFPFSVSSATNTLNIGSGSRADRIGNGSLPTDQRTLQRWFDITAFTPPGAQLFGNAGRNILTGPGTRQLDFSAFKDIHWSAKESRRLQFRAEFFNLSNTPQFNNPSASIGTPSAGTIGSAGSPVSLQRTSRQIQFALKLYF